MKAAALRYALSDRANAGRIAVVDFGITEPSTKAAVAALSPITEDKFTTVVFTRDNINEWLSVRNIPTVHPIFCRSAQHVRRDHRSVRGLHQGSFRSFRGCQDRAEGGLI